MCGLPYSGKTTLRKSLIAKLDCDYISIDEIMTNHNMWRKGHPTKEDWGMASFEALEKLKNELNYKNTIIFDQANLTYDERQSLRNIASSCNASVFLVLLDISLAEIKNRRNENLKTNKRGHVTDEPFNFALEMYEKPKKDEQPIIYSGINDLLNRLG